MLGRRNDLITSGGTSAEDQMKINAIRYENEELYEKGLYREAAKRVVFAKCFEGCGLDHKEVKQFNRNFYYGMPFAQACLQDCYNTRMTLHFGPTAVKQEGLALDFDALKREYGRYEKMNPALRSQKAFAAVSSPSEVESITKSLIEKTREARGKFDFQ